MKRELKNPLYEFFFDDHLLNIILIRIKLSCNGHELMEFLIFHLSKIMSSIFFDFFVDCDNSRELLLHKKKTRYNSSKKHNKLSHDKTK